MEEYNNYNCVWWNSFICSNCNKDGSCEHYLDELSIDGKYMHEKIENEFNSALEVIREYFRNNYLKGEIK